MTSTPITTKFEMWITHYANDPQRVRVFTAARAIFNQYTPEVRKHGNRWWVEMVDANGVTFNETHGHLFSGEVAKYGNFYKTKREASAHTFTNEETRDFQYLCVDVAWELD